MSDCKRVSLTAVAVRWCVGYYGRPM